MTSSIGDFDGAYRRHGAGGRISAALRRALGWPVRVHRARQTMLQLGSLDDHELRDIGLSRQDLRDASALAFDTDPSLTLRRCSEARRRRAMSRRDALTSSSS